MKYSITIRLSLFIRCTPVRAWDYTQNYAERPRWDTSVLEAAVLQESPHRLVRLKVKGNTSMVFRYRQEDRPYKTSLATSEVQSPFLESAGGSWLYTEEAGGTRWTQTNTLVFKKHFLLPLLLPFFKWNFRRQTRRAMKKAKAILEAGS